MMTFIYRLSDIEKDTHLIHKCANNNISKLIHTSCQLFRFAMSILHIALYAVHEMRHTYNHIHKYI